MTEAVSLGGTTPLIWNILTSRRNTVLVCSARCMLHAMAQMNKSLYQICVFIPKEMERKELVKECFERMGMSENDYQSYLTFSDEEKDNVMERGIKQMIREIKKNIMYSNLRWIVESVYPQGQLKVINSKLEVDNKARMKKETLLTVKSTTTTTSILIRVKTDKANLLVHLSFMIIIN